MNLIKKTLLATTVGLGLSISPTIQATQNGVKSKVSQQLSVDTDENQTIKLLSTKEMQNTLPEYKVEQLKRKNMIYHKGAYRDNKYRIGMLDIGTTGDQKSKYPEIANNPVNLDKEVVTVYTHRDLHLFKGGEDDNLSWVYGARKSDFINGYFYNEVSQEVYLQWLESKKIDTANLLNSGDILYYLNIPVSLQAMLELVSDYSHIKNSHVGIFVDTINKQSLRAKVYSNPELLKKHKESMPDNYKLTTRLIDLVLNELKIDSIQHYDIIMESINFSKDIQENWNKKSIDFKARNRAHKYYNKENKTLLIEAQQLFSEKLFKHVNTVSKTIIDSANHNNVTGNVAYRK